MRFLSALLNSKSDKLDVDIVVGMPLRHAKCSLGAELTAGKSSRGLEVDGEREGSGPDELPVEVSGCYDTPDRARGVPPGDASWCGAKGNYRNDGEMP